MREISEETHGNQFWIRTLGRNLKESPLGGVGPHVTSYPFEHGERNTETAVATTNNLAGLRVGIPHTFTVDQLPPGAFPRIDTRKVLHLQRCLPQHDFTLIFFFLLSASLMAPCKNAAARRAAFWYSMLRIQCLFDAVQKKTGLFFSACFTLP